MGVIVVNGIEYSGSGMGGESSNIVYLTEAEYDALPDSKYTDDVEYRITDAGIGSVTASNVKYDNSNSGLEAINTQSAIDKLNESLNWKLVGQIKGNSKITLPNGFNELYVEVKNGHMDWIHQYNIPYVTLTNSYKYYMSGFHKTDAVNHMTQIGCAKTNVYLATVVRNNNDETANSTITVYYR